MCHSYPVLGEREIDEFGLEFSIQLCIKGTIDKVKVMVA
jgi:hypothetical protein